jgi:hypothetical protein
MTAGELVLDFTAPMVATMWPRSPGPPNVMPAVIWAAASASSMLKSTLCDGNAHARAHS